MIVEPALIVVSSEAPIRRVDRLEIEKQKRSDINHKRKSEAGLRNGERVQASPLLDIKPESSAKVWTRRIHNGEYVSARRDPGLCPET